MTSNAEYLKSSSAEFKKQHVIWACEDYVEWRKKRLEERKSEIITKYADQSSGVFAALFKEKRGVGAATLMWESDDPWTSIGYWPRSQAKEDIDWALAIAEVAKACSTPTVRLDLLTARDLDIYGSMKSRGEVL